jgi:superfamily II DNA/RNA helicase
LDGHSQCNSFLRRVAIVTSKTGETTSIEDIGSAQIIVGTSCAGTGLDVSGVGHIIIVGLPFSIEQLLQWAGRCRARGNVTVVVPSFHLQMGGEMAGEDFE